MTGFKSKRKASLDTLYHMPYQGRPTRPEEFAPEPVAWISEYGVQELTFDNQALGSLEWEVKRNRERGHDVPLYLHPAVQSAARAIAEEQSYDTGLWFVATTVTEAHLQAALRRLAAAVEGEAPVARTPLTDEQMDQIMHDCGLSVTARDIARAIEQAHGIKGKKT
jgi:hypothetical protein